jgi:hypothetical protein
MARPRDDLRTVSLTPRELSVVRNLVRAARGRATPADMRWVIDLDTLAIVLDEAMDRSWDRGSALADSDAPLREP